VKSNYLPIFTVIYERGGGGGGKVFDDLRAVLRLDDGKSQRTSPNVVSSDEQAEILQKMELCFTNFSDSMEERRAAQGLSKDERKMLDIVWSHLKRHGRYLWGHVLQMPEEAGGGIRIVARTNNILEGFFHQMKHGERRRSGRRVLTQISRDCRQPLLWPVILPGPTTSNWFVDPWRSCPHGSAPWTWRGGKRSWLRQKELLLNLL